MLFRSVSQSRYHATLHFFYVPNRILWKNWGKFIAGENYQPLQISKSPTVDFKSVKGTLLDYLGLPITDKLPAINAFPILAYFRIFNDYYQDQNNDPTFTSLRDNLELIRDAVYNHMFKSTFDNGNATLSEKSSIDDSTILVGYLLPLEDNPIRLVLS